MTVVPTDVREALASSITGYATETGPSSRRAAMLSTTSSTPSGAANPNMMRRGAGGSGQRALGLGKQYRRS
jgi:hypothetical protein